MSNTISICIAELLQVESCNGLDVIGDNGSACVRYRENVGKAIKEVK